MRREDIARVCHEANRAYCECLGDTSQLPWAKAPQWQRESCINGVIFYDLHPDAGPEVSHRNWMAEKHREGWTYGKVKDVERRKHPCMVPYHQLPVEQRLKDALFVGIVRALGGIK